MSKTQILQLYKQSLLQQRLQDNIAKNEPLIQIKGLVGSSLSFVISNAFLETKRPFLLIFNDKETAAYHLNDFEQLLQKDHVLFYPGSYRRPYQIEETDNTNVLLRAEVLNRINSRKKPALIVTYPDALFENVVTRKALERQTLKITVGDKLSISFINEVLFDYQFNRVDFVTEPGEFSVRGGIVDVFSFSNDFPYRIEFFGEVIDSIRTFDIETQLSLEQIKTISVIPNLANKHIHEKRQPFLDYIASKTTIFLEDSSLLFSKLDKLYNKALETFSTLDSQLQRPKPEVLFCNAQIIKNKLIDFTVVTFKNSTSLEQTNNKPKIIEFSTTPQPAFNKKINLLINHLNQKNSQGFKPIITCTTDQQSKRFKTIFEDSEQDVHYKTILLPLHQGFVDNNLKILCYTDHQIFERYHKFYLKNGYKKKQAITLKELTNLDIGDFVTHIDHGIGKFGGLQKINVEGKTHEAIKLIYANRDILYLSIHTLHKITRYNSKDGKTPKIYKLGSKAWKNLKQKTKTRVKDIAFNLIQLYAKRKMKLGFQYGPDSFMQHELEASFVYEDTPDQSLATADVKTDMESKRPMDRLVCGDVGFGKTEVAIRAAFKAVDNGKQVAILVPTTILAFQHYKTFNERLKNFPVTVGYLNRFRTAKQRRETIEDLKKGSLDILIGTHQLVNKAVQFKDLGLLIVDEEQKFGVAIKDKLKTIKDNVDVLTLTATPIPRTLQFSLMAARDLSVINTPPPNRFPIESHVVRFNEKTIRDAIHYEIQRGGQVFFVHNRIENIKEVAGLIQRLLPDAKIGIGHGQLEGKKLEQLMLAFMNGEFDILVSTTIIESGLDVPNANTILINNANHFGLSDLHQMRGRVGRSNKKAFCYFITPEYSAMTKDARKRIQALEQYTELGSGFNIAMKDLEIRGAGDLLGGEQSGFINEMGFDTYQKILSEAINELKETEFKELYKDENQDKNYVKDFTIDTNFELLFPDDYVNNISERLNLYTRLSQISTEQELDRFQIEVIDRFGDLPIQVSDLFLSVKLKWIAMQLGLEKVIMKQQKLVGYFISDKTNYFYNSNTFTKVLQFVQKKANNCTLKEKETRQGLRLLITFVKINNIEEALKTLRSILA